MSELTYLANIPIEKEAAVTTLVAGNSVTITTDDGTRVDITAEDGSFYVYADLEAALFSNYEEGETAFETAQGAIDAALTYIREVG